MRALFVVDPLEGLDAATDTSIGLMHAVQERSDEAWVAEARHLEVRIGKAHAYCTSIFLESERSASDGGRIVPDQWYKLGPVESIPLDVMDAIFMRTEPPVDTAYLTAAHVLGMVEDESTALINAPGGLRSCSEHLLGLHFPDLVPPTLVTASEAAIAEFVAVHSRAVLKPVDSFSGRGVFMLDHIDPNLRSIVEMATNRGSTLVVVQPYLQAVEDGNKRLFVFDGELVDGTLRHPVPGDFRIANPDASAELTERDRFIVDRLRPLLYANGLRLVGLDVIGEFLIEVNLTSVGALRKADALLGSSLCADLVDRVLQHPGPWR